MYGSYFGSGLPFDFGVDLDTYKPKPSQVIKKQKKNARIAGVFLLLKLSCYFGIIKIIGGG